LTQQHCCVFSKKTYTGAGFELGSSVPQAEEIPLHHAARGRFLNRFQGENFKGLKFASSQLDGFLNYSQVLNKF
jgi:hypothetical protein